MNGLEFNFPIHHLKTERNRLNRKLTKITKEKHDLQERYNELLEQLTQLNSTSN